MSDAWNGIPKWFQRLLIPVIVAVPVVFYVADYVNRVVNVEKDIKSLTARTDETENSVQRFEIQQAVMDEKLDRVLDWVDKQDDP